jgi:hypothetical protein
MKSQAVPKSAKQAPVSRPNLSRLMKLNNPAAQPDFQPVRRNGKFDDIGVLFLVRQRPIVTTFNHNHALAARSENLLVEISAAWIPLPPNGVLDRAEI